MAVAEVSCNNVVGRPPPSPHGCANSSAVRHLHEGAARSAGWPRGEARSLQGESGERALPVRWSRKRLRQRRRLRGRQQFPRWDGGGAATWQLAAAAGGRGAEVPAGRQGDHQGRDGRGASCPLAAALRAPKRRARELRGPATALPDSSGPERDSGEPHADFVAFRLFGGEAGAASGRLQLEAEAACVVDKPLGSNPAEAPEEASPLALMTKKAWNAVVQDSARGTSVGSTVRVTRETPKESQADQSKVSKGWSSNHLVEMPVVLVDRERELEIMFQSVVVGVHFQFASKDAPNIGSESDPVEVDRLVAIALSSSSASDPTVVMHMESLDKMSVIASLKSILRSSKIVKVMHDVHRAAFWLYCNGLQDVELVNCVDLQLLYEATVDAAVLNADILQIATHSISESSENLSRSMHSFKARMKPVEAAEWIRTPLTGKLLQSLAQAAKLYAQCYAEISPEASLSGSCVLMTSSRWQYAIENHGHKAIWFDPAADNTARSLESLVLHASNASGNGDISRADMRSLELLCELDPLLDLLPSEYEDAILDIDDYHTKLVDVCLDVGRIPPPSTRSSRTSAAKCASETTTEPASTDSCTASP
ncbi:hypothetical protein ON010_g9851 [Phytophthora cinnamomi]|nr:hypothetical protein ON010_g9851 [Phytophthora cinnamomi]